MIDWIKAIIPCKHEGRIEGGQIMSIDQEGAIEWISPKRKPVEGSYSSKVHIKSYDIDKILIDGNPAKFLQGHNLFGSNNLLGLNFEFFSKICKISQLQPSNEDLQAWAIGNYDLSRVDCTSSFALPSQNDVMTWLRAASATSTSRGRHQTASAYSGETLYFGQHSRRISLKLYNKWRELQKHPLHDALPFKNQLEEYAKPLLRSEVRLLTMELKKRSLNKASHWKNESVIDEIIRERIETLKMNEKIRLSDSELEVLPARLLGPYELWRQGMDLRNIYPKTTFYRYRSELEKYGIDLSAPRPKQAEVIPLIKFLSAEQVAEVPGWAKGTELYYEPEKLKIAS